MCKRIIERRAYAGSRSVIRSADGFEQWDQRRDVEKREIRLGHGRVQVDAASIDPGNRQAERLSADHVGELRLAGMENFVHRHVSVVDKVAEQGPVWLVTSRPFGRANEVEIAAEPSRGKQVVDIGYQGEVEVLAKGLQRRSHVGIQFKPAVDAKTSK